MCSLILMLLFPDQLNVIAMRQRRELSTQQAVVDVNVEYWSLLTPTTYVSTIFLSTRRKAKGIGKNRTANGVDFGKTWVD